MLSNKTINDEKIMLDEKEKIFSMDDDIAKNLNIFISVIIKYHYVFQVITLISMW